MKVKDHPIWLLALGFVLMAGAHLTFNIEILAWFAATPFLLYLHRTNGWRSRLWFVLVYALAWSAIVCKITTDPIPWLMVPMFSIPIALVHVPAYLLWASRREWKYGLFLFPAALSILEWLQYTFTPFGSWGAAAYTQGDHIVLIQLVSLFGLAGLSFLLYWVNVVVAEAIIQRRIAWRIALPPAVTLLLTLGFGSLRYDMSKATGRSMTLVAAVGTDSEVGNGPLPTNETRERNVDILFTRTRQAAGFGAELIVWNEAAAMVWPEEEARWKDSLSALAKENGVTLVAAYVVPLSKPVVRYENKYLFIHPDGSVAETYYKHEPVPGEPAVKGTAPFQSHQVGEITIAGAICYDYDFPYIARAFRHKGADVVALPSSDWRGIDPIHTKMAAFRAIEQGHSIIRSTRFGRSAAITPFGEMNAQMSSFDEHDQILLAYLPRAHVTSLYSLVGDLWVYLCIIFVIGTLTAPHGSRITGYLSAAAASWRQGSYTD